jgi:ferredoxin
VTHYYAKISVAEIRAMGELKVGDEFVEDRHVLEQAQKGCPVGIIRIE